MERRKISAFIPVQNNEKIIRDCLESVTWCDEIFIVDAFSEDNTVEICKEYPNVKIVQHEYINSGEQCFWGLAQVAHGWVFKIDSDERCTPELRDEILRILSQDEIPYDGFNIPIRTVFWGKLLKHRTYLGSGGKRLFKKEMYKNYRIRNVHSSMRIDNKTWLKKKNAFISHDPIRSFDSQWQKLIRYSNWHAMDMKEKGIKPNFFHFTARPLFKFFHNYIFRGGFLDGLHGFILCAIAGISIFMKYHKLWEMYQKESMNE